MAVPSKNQKTKLQPSPMDHCSSAVEHRPPYCFGRCHAALTSRTDAPHFSACPLFHCRFIEAADVQIEHPVHMLRQQPRIERIQRVMLAASRTESIRKTEKVGFVNSVHHLNRRALDDLIFQRRNSEWSQPPISLGDVHPTHRLGSVCSALQPMGESLEVGRGSRRRAATSLRPLQARLLSSNRGRPHAELQGHEHDAEAQ